MKRNSPPTRQERNAMFLFLSKKSPWWGVLVVAPVLLAVGEFLNIQFGEFARAVYKLEFNRISILNVCTVRKPFELWHLGKTPTRCPPAGQQPAERGSLHQSAAALPSSRVPHPPAGQQPEHPQPDHRPRGTQFLKIQLRRFPRALKRWHTALMPQK